MRKNLQQSEFVIIVLPDTALTVAVQRSQARPRDCREPLWASRSNSSFVEDGRVARTDALDKNDFQYRVVLFFFFLVISIILPSRSISSEGREIKSDRVRGHDA